MRFELLSHSCLSDSVFDLISNKSLVVEHFTDLSSVKSEMRVREVDEGNTHDEDDKVNIVTLTMGVKWIITSLVTIWLIVHVVFLLESVRVAIRGENVNMVKKSLIVMVSEWVVKGEDSVAGTFEAIDGKEFLVTLGNELVVTISGHDGSE